MFRKTFDNYSSPEHEKEELVKETSLKEKERK